MDYTHLPKFIRDATILSKEEKEKLASIDKIPTDEEVMLIRHDPEFFDLLNAFIGDESSRMTHLQLKAKDYLQENQISMAWKILLLE